MRIPFDGFTLSAVAQELQSLVGQECQRIVQTGEATVVLCFWDGKEESYLLLSAEGGFSRAHRSFRKPEPASKEQPIAHELRKHIQGLLLESVSQRGEDRILDLRFGAPSRHGVWLVAELFPKHPNLILVGSSGHCLVAARWIGASRSDRPVLPGKPYLPPPMPPGSFQDSPFLKKLTEAGADLQPAPHFSPGTGAYPVDVSALGLPSIPRRSISQALEQAFAERIDADRVGSLKTSLLTQLKRVIAARKKALESLQETADTAARARTLQMRGELILAFAHSLEPGQSELEAIDYEGQAVKISLDPTLSPAENADRLFRKAKKAKESAANVNEQIERITQERAAAEGLLQRVEAASRPDELVALREQADARKWLHHQPQPGLKAEDKPFEGKRVRELAAPHGYRILFGENAEANDYLTMRVAKPNDWWLHVRGAVSAHVIVPAANKPERVPPEVIDYAARIAAQNSASKHSSYIAVDYTLRRYVRKPKGSPKGFAVYTHEKTLHVEGDTVSRGR